MRAVRGAPRSVQRTHQSSGITDESNSDTILCPAWSAAFGQQFCRGFEEVGDYLRPRRKQNEPIPPLLLTVSNRQAVRRAQSRESSPRLYYRSRIGLPPASLLRCAASINAKISSVSSFGTGVLPVWK